MKCIILFWYCTFYWFVICIWQPKLNVFVHTKTMATIRQTRDCSSLFFLFCNRNKWFLFYPEKKRLTCADCNDTFYRSVPSPERNRLQIHMSCANKRLKYFHHVVTVDGIAVVVALAGLRNNVIITWSFYNSVF